MNKIHHGSHDYNDFEINEHGDVKKHHESKSWKIHKNDYTDYSPLKHYDHEQKMALKHKDKKHSITDPTGHILNPGYSSNSVETDSSDEYFYQHMYDNVPSIETVPVDTKLLAIKKQIAKKIVQEHGIDEDVVTHGVLATMTTPEEVIALLKSLDKAKSFVDTSKIDFYKIMQEANNPILAKHARIEHDIGPDVMNDEHFDGGSVPVAESEWQAIPKVLRITDMIREGLIRRLVTGEATIDCGNESCGFPGLDKIWGYGKFKHQKFFSSCEKNYSGCHCYFGPDWNNGKSKPVNEIDSACFNLNQCYRCVKIDSRDENDHNCTPFLQNFLSPQNKVISRRGVAFACEKANEGNDCASRTCSCDTQFVESLLDLFFSGHVFDATKKHTVFDPEEECQVAPGQCDNCYYECCGEYPFRYPFRTSDVSPRQCCGTKTYNKLTKKCCEGNVLKNQC